MSAVRVTVDSSTCIGSGNCVWRAPAVFDQRDEDGTAVVIEPSLPEALHELVREAERHCPTGAIRVDEEGVA